MATWKRLPQEEEDEEYFFGGQCYLSYGVSINLSYQEILAILIDLHQFVRERQGIDYLQVYVREDGLRIWIIDQLRIHELADYLPKDNHYTLLFPEEY